MTCSLGYRWLTARGATPSAFERRCIPTGGVAPPSNIPDILSRCALPFGRFAALGATMDLHHGLLRRPARGRLPCRAVGKLFEVRAPEETPVQVLRILNDGGQDQPGIAGRLNRAVEVFRQDRVLAVGHAVRLQVTWPHARGDDFQIAAAQRRTASASLCIGSTSSTPAASACRLP